MTTAAPAPRHVAAGDGTTFWFLGNRFTLKATGEETAGIFGLIEAVQPAGFAAPPHIHHAEDEVLYILAGELTFYCGETTLPARAGSLVCLPRGVPHWFRVEGEEPARLLQWNFPGGLERFFLDAGEPVADPVSPPAGPPDVARMLALAPRYQLEILGPPPAEAPDAGAAR